MLDYFFVSLKAEPIWLTAKNQKLKTTSLFWTGSEVNY
jgi:hypothetical protein